MLMPIAALAREQLSASGFRAPDPAHAGILAYHAGRFLGGGSEQDRYLAGASEMLSMS